MEVPLEVAQWLHRLQLLPSPSPTLPAELSVPLLHGSFFLPLLSSSLAGRTATVPALSPISTAPTPAAKLTNWSTVFKACTALEVKVTEEQRLLILAGDHQSVINLLSALCVRLERGGRKPKAAGDGSLFIESLDVVRPLAQADSCLEFLLLSLCQHFRLKPRQAAGLLTQSNKYLAQILAKGLKTDYQPVRNWMKSLQKASGALILLLGQEDRMALGLVLSALRPGLLSLDESVVKECAALFKQLLPPLTLSNDTCWHWFAGPQGGLEACLQAVRRFGEAVLGDVAEVMNTAARFKVKDLLVHRLKAQTESVEEYLQVLAEVVPRLLRLQGGERLVEEDVIPHLTELALREADADSKRPLSVRMCALTLLCALWKCLPQYYSERESLVSFVLALLKKGCRDKAHVLGWHSAALLFDLLKALTQEKSHLAPQIFKSLTFLLVEAFEDLPMRELLVSNWTVILKEIPGLPVTTLVEPLCKHLSLSQALLGLSDFHLLAVLAVHPRLGLEQAVILADICGKQCLSLPYLSSAAGLSLLRLAQRFLDSAVMQEFLFRYLKLGVGLLGEEEVKPRLRHKRVLSAPMPEDLEETAIRAQQKHVIAGLTTKVIHMNCSDLNERLKAMLVKTILEVKKSKYDYNKDLIKLLALLGHPPTLLGTDSFQTNKSPKRLAFLATPVVRISQSHLNPPVLRSQSKKAVAKKPLRMQQSSPTLLETPALEVVKVRELDCSPEETSDLEAALKMHSRLLKQLYRTYCGSCYAKGPTDQDTFEHQGSKRALIREAEMYKLLRDNGLSSTYLLKEQFSSLLRSYCVRYKTQEPTAIDYSQYVDLLVQVALFVYARPGSALASLAPAVATMMLFRLFREHWQTTGRSLALFDAPYLLRGDRDTLIRLNEQLKRHPDLELPEGYSRTTRTEVELRFDLPAESGVKETFRLAMELLDEVLAGGIGLHLLEPRVVSQTVVRVQATGPAQSSPRADTHSGPVDSIHRNPGLRNTLIKLQPRFSKLDLQEVARLLDDLVTSLEAQQTASPRVHNRALFLREQREKAYVQEQQRAELRRRRRQEELELLLAKASEAKRKRLRRERHRKRKAETKQHEAEIRQQTMRKQEADNRARELLRWMRQKQIESMEKRKADTERQQAVEVARKLRRQTFMKKAQTRLQQLFKEKTEACKLEVLKTQEAAKLIEDRKEAGKRRATGLLEQEKQRREEDQRLKQDMTELSCRPDVVAVVEEHKKSLETLYEFYAKVGAKDPLFASQLLWAGLWKLSLHFLLVPELISSEELTILFRVHAKATPASGLSYSQFTDCLVRVAAVGQAQLQTPTQCSIKALLEYMELPLDARKVVDVIKAKIAALPLHQRDRKRLVRARISSLAS